MNVYDFDKTIYDGDSTLDFYKYCVIHYPKILLCLPKQGIGFFKYKLKKIDKTAFKECFYCFLQKVSDTDNVVSDFWDTKEKNIKEWYINQQRDDDIVISASPEFLLKEICNRIGVNKLIASKVDAHSGKYEGVNCYGKEKVYRFEKEVNGKIDCFYSDSFSDKPMMQLAKKSFIVKKSKLEELNFYSVKRG